MRAAFAVVAVAVLAGCGGGGVSEQSYAKKANTICKRYRKKANAITLGAPTRPELKRVIHRTIELIREENRRLRALEPPSGLRRNVNNMLNARDRLLDIFEDHADAIVDAALKREPTAANRLQATLAPAVRRAVRLTRTVGLPACVRELKN